eukprot:CAMPEP_0119013982 /NCGR_PEP_ID=MMETSP1176-20130426/9292_1 /TAXON_ID=265551 /ORGANISM="Synedropsis recta cf, Strain CCMP1620" /LENGTH=131 /DNA_ID=CAMNT_0006967115 /DNA_START=66 /DNA_END=461 /DNA_ORIENTATION=+
MTSSQDDDIFHLVQADVWGECKSKKVDYVPATYEQDGFIHATREASFLLKVANLYFKESVGDFLLLRIRPSLLKDAPVKYEAPPDAVGDPDSAEAVTFPHIYGTVNTDSVMEEYAVNRSEDGSFTGVVGLS